MCGIAGYVGEGDKLTLKRMVASLKHRGPDGEGVFEEGEVGLAHTRLAVIDLTDGGAQPMRSTDGKTVISFNGEIYNHRTLRSEIEKKGKYRFRSHSDTEVILALYEEWGLDAFRKLEGQFAIALYDSKKKEVVLVRDRAGEKPLYYMERKGTLVFGSELKALMCHSSWEGVLDPGSLATYLSSEYVPSPRTIFKDVKKLPPASMLVWKNSAVSEMREFWMLSEGTTGTTYEEAKDELDRLLEQSVGKMLEADVPVGIFLSGGIDSSTVAYYAAKQKADVHTFSIGFEEKSYDESFWARQVADYLGTTHHMEIFSSRACIDTLIPTIEHLDEPLADASVLPTALLSGFTRRFVTVALGGDGSDELFAGYSTFQAEKMLAWYLRLPSKLRNAIIEPVIRKLPTRNTYMSLDFRLKKFLEGSEASSAERHQRWLGAFSEEELPSLLSDDVRRDARDVSVYAHLGRFHDPAVGDATQQMLYAYLRSYLADQVLVKVDRASMVHALEVRAPFLDHNIMEFAHALPYDYKFASLTGKRILRDLMKGRLPSSVIARAKKGFGIPTGAWLKGPLKGVRDELLSSSGVYETGYFNVPYIERLKSEHDSGAANHQKKLWTLFVFALWHDAWGKQTMY